jgi:hypothetical protein
MAKTEAKSAKTVGTLKPASYNPRTITDKQLSMLKKSMAEFGDLSGLVKNVRTGNLVGGHQRIKNLDPSWPIISAPHTDKTGTVSLGYIETPSGRWQYREVDWPEKKEAAANIAANKQGGEFDMTLLRDLIITLDTGDMDMELIGFNSHELELMMTAFHVNGIDAPELKDGDRAPFIQMTFTLHDTQAEELNAAILKAKGEGGAQSGVNENSNGNALAFIAERFNRG